MPMTNIKNIRLCIYIWTSISWDVTYELAQEMVDVGHEDDHC